MVRGCLQFGKLPSDDKLITIRCVCPTIPFECTLVDNLDYFVQKIGQIRLQDICIVDEILNPADHKDSINLLARDHYIQVSISRRDLVSNDNRSELPERHLEQISDSEYRFLEFDRFHLAFILSLLVLKLGRLRLIEWIVSQGLDYAHHFGDRVNDQLLSIIREHDGTSSQNQACENGRHKLEHGLILDFLSLIQPDVGH